MRQTLFYIPQEWAGISVFGFGWVLGLWVVASIVSLIIQTRGRGWSKDASGLLKFQLLVAAGIAILLPLLETPLGLPIRGYGLMMLLGVVGGVIAAAYRAQQVGIDPDRIYELLIWFFFAGFGGARFFFVVQYFEQFRRDSLWKTITEIFRFTEGGLVVYGALLGAVIAFFFFTRRYRIPPLRLADVIAPSLMLGLALGRIGCLLNGCCYGGLCAPGHPGITFPKFSAPEKSQVSPAYHDQWMSGSLHGFVLGADSAGRPIVADVLPGSAASRAGLESGIVVSSVNARPVTSLAHAQGIMLRAGPDIHLVDASGEAYAWTIGMLPERSLPVYPSQIYSAINAFLIFLVAWFCFPVRQREGQVFGLVMTIYPVTRFLLEVIRNDEPGQFGTVLTISQWVSILLLIAMLVYWSIIMHHPGNPKHPGFPKRERGMKR